MKNIPYFIIMLLMFWNGPMYSQEISASMNQDLLKHSDLRELVLFAETSENPQVEPSHSTSGNQIFIQQIGDSNYIKSTVNSQESSIEIIQSGNNNFAELEATVKSAQGSILQNGDDNFSLTSVHDPHANLFLNVTINGDNHHFESHGTNSIGNKLHFNLTGDSKTIIVRNFK